MTDASYISIPLSTKSEQWRVSRPCPHLKSGEVSQRSGTLGGVSTTTTLVALHNLQLQRSRQPATIYSKYHDQSLEYLGARHVDPWLHTETPELKLHITHGPGMSSNKHSTAPRQREKLAVISQHLGQDVSITKPPPAMTTISLRQVTFAASTK
jgi:hypothetical protein